MNIFKKLYIAELQNRCLELENILKDLKGFETSATYEKTAALLNDILQEMEYIKRG